MIKTTMISKSAMLFHPSLLAQEDEAGKVRNSVRAPVKGDESFEVWAALNELQELGAIPTLKTAHKLARAMNRDENSTVVTFLQWKKFHE